MELYLGLALGFIAGTAWNTITAAWKSRQDFKERQLLINKLISHGDAAVNYNLNLADEVAKAPATIRAAVENEVSVRQPQQVEELRAPWDDHPDYSGCDVTFLEDSDKVLIFDPNAADGPDCWEEDREVFMKKLETFPLTNTPQ